MYTIYKHTLILDCPHKGWSYIGLTKQNLKRRWKNGTGYDPKTQPAFANAIKKYGWENFSHEVLEENITTLEEACEREKYWIAYYHTFTRDPERRGYNCTLGGEGHNGRIPSLEVRQKMSQSHLGKSHPWTEHQRQVMTGRFVGRKVSDETRKKLSISHLGKKPSAESIEKSRKAKFKKVVCVETGIMYESFIAAAESINKTAPVISACIRGKQKTAGGFHWQLYNKFEEDSKN